MPVSRPPNFRECRTEIIDTTEQIADLVDQLILYHVTQYSETPTMCLDLEGVNLCREGSLSILTLLVDTGIPPKRVCLIDVYTLGEQAFITAGAKGKTLKDVLQDERIPKVFFDVRNDSDALFAHFDVALQGIKDVQLMESAARETTRSRRFLNSLSKCVEDYLSLGPSKLANWKLAKEKGEKLFKAEHGGSHDVFNHRPISEDIISYCVGDVQYLPELRAKFEARVSRWKRIVDEECKKRVAMSQSADYQPHGRDRALAPWSQYQNITLDQRYKPPMLSDAYDDYDDFFEDDYQDSYDWYD